MLFGEHAVVYGEPCLVTAVDQRISAQASLYHERELLIEAPQLGVLGYQRPLGALGGPGIPKQVRFIEAIVKRFDEEHGLNKGVRVKTRSDFLVSYGLGSSSAVTVATAVSLAKLYELDLKPKELFDLCFQAVLAVQGVGSGFDLAAALWGGTILYHKGAERVKEIELDDLPVVVCYSGQKADTPTLVRQVAELKKNQPMKVTDIFNQIGHLTLMAQETLIQGDWPKTGQLMNQNQVLLRQLKVSTPQLERLIGAALGAGAWGAKLSGAGGGDNLIVLCPSRGKVRVETALRETGGEIVKIKLNSKRVS